MVLRTLLHRRRAAEGAAGRLQGTTGVAAATAVQKSQLAAKALQHHLRYLALVTIAIRIFARLQLAFESNEINEI